MSHETQGRAGRGFDELFMQAPLGIAVIDSLTGRICAVNPAFARIAGRGEDELTRLDWTSLLHPDDAKADLDQTAPLNAGQSAGFRTEKRCLRPDGSVVWIRMTISPVKSEDAARPRRLCMIEGISRVSSDAIAQKIESLGVLAGGIAHDFNNSLAAILGNLSLLRSRVEGDGKSLELVKEAQEACESARGVSNQLLTFSKGGTPVAAVPEAEPPAREARRRRVLIMDDEPQVARVLSRMLEHMGHQAETVRHGEAALESYRGAMETGEPYDAVILDLTVRGGLGAPETLRELAAIDPGVKALVSSGYGDDPIISDFGSFGFRAALAKPYRLDDVASALRLAVGSDRD